MDQPDKASSSHLLFDRVPGPSPWFLVPDTGWYRGPYIPIIGGYSWQPIRAKFPDASGTALVGFSGAVALLGYQVYVSVLDNSHFLVWYQNSARPGDLLSPPVHLAVIDPNQLNSLTEDLQSSVNRMRASKQSLLLGGQPVAEIDLFTSNIEEEQIADFPDSIRSIEELLILCHSSSLGIELDVADLALMVVRPKQGRYRLYPQDWFNHSGADFGYEWVTRVVRNPHTGHIHGEGFRITSFVLDDSLRNLRK